MKERTFWNKVTDGARKGKDFVVTGAKKLVKPAIYACVTAAVGGVCYAIGKGAFTSSSPVDGPADELVDLEPVEDLSEVEITEF